MKNLVVIFCALLSSTLFAQSVAVITGDENKEAFFEEEKSNGQHSRLVKRLRRVKSLLEENDVDRAIRKLDRIIERLEQGGGIGKTFNRIGIVYNTLDYSFRCNGFNQDRAKQIAADSAKSLCFRAGHRRCEVMSNVLTGNGYIGYLNGIYYGYGCTASAVVHGYNY